MDNAEVMGFGQSLGNLLGNGDGLPCRQGASLLNENLEILPRHVLHGDEQLLAVLVELVHPADVLVGYFAGQLDLVPEAVDRRFVKGYFRMENLEGDLLADFLIESAVNLPHPPRAELFYKLKPSCYQLPLAQPFGSRFERPGDGE